MADSFIQIAADSTGKKLDTRTEGTNAEHRQVVVIGDGATNANIAPVDVTKGLAVDLTASGALPTVTNLSQLGGQAVAMGTGVRSAGTQRVTVATDDLVQAKLTDGTNAVTVKAASTAPVATDPALVVAISPNTQNANGQAIMANSTPVAIASDQTYGNSTGSAVPAKAMYDGVQAVTSLPTAATAGNLVGISGDKYGRPIYLPITIRDLTGTQTTTISASTSETTIVTAGGAGVFNDLVMLVVSNTSASTNTRIDFRDATAGSILFSLQSNGGQPPVGFCPALAIPQTTANSNWTAQCATSTTDIRIYAVYAKNK